MDKVPLLSRDESVWDDKSSMGSALADTVAKGTKRANARATLSRSLARLRSLRWWGDIGLGQLLSLLVTGMGVTSQLLSQNGFNLPVAQSFMNYALLAMIYSPMWLARDGSEHIVKVVKQSWWKYVIMGICDVEANFFVVWAYQYTSITSVQLLDGTTILWVAIMSYIFLKVRFNIPHYVGIAICIIGFIAFVVSDLGNDQNSIAPNPGLGDGLCIIGAFLYAVSNVGQEFLVKASHSIEFLCLLGVFGTVVSGIQMYALESQSLASVDWSASTVGLVIGFSLMLFFMYSLVPMVLIRSGATMMNLSLLTADIYALFFGIFIFHLEFSWLYLLSFSVVFIGLIIYKAAPTTAMYEPTTTENAPLSANPSVVTAETAFA